jgi:hypothetical protein
MTPKKNAPRDAAKREFLKRGTYVVPAILSLGAAPSFASAGSGAPRSSSVSNIAKNKDKTKMKIQKMLEALLKALSKDG